MKKVFFQGCFDLINHGHISAFRDLRAQGDYLVIGLNTDELMMDYKKRTPLLPFWQRKLILESIKYIDEVVPATHFSPLELLKEHHINIYGIYKDWVSSKDEEIAYMQSVGGSIYVTPEYEDVIHSSSIRKKLFEEFSKE